MGFAFWVPAFLWLVLFPLLDQSIIFPKVFPLLISDISSWVNFILVRLTVLGQNWLCCWLVLVFLVPCCLFCSLSIFLFRLLQWVSFFCVSFWSMFCSMIGQVFEHLAAQSRCSLYNCSFIFSFLMQRYIISWLMRCWVAIQRVR